VASGESDAARSAVSMILSCGYRPRSLATSFGVAGHAPARARGTRPVPAPARPGATQPARLAARLRA
jgi:hypothetical protein